MGNGRIPYGDAHPQCWGRPYTGKVLFLDDVRAWEGTLAFGKGRPSQKDTTEHVRKCCERGLLRGVTPVQWSFGRVLWERTSSLLTAEEDLAAFERAKALGSPICTI